VHANVGWSVLIDGIPRSSLFWAPTQVRSWVRPDNRLTDAIEA
jgi:hypothetical protein